MTRAIILAAALAASVCGRDAMAQDFTLLREGHPRLELTPQDLERLRADEAEVERARAAADDFIARGRTRVYEDYFVTLPQPEFPPAHDDGWPYWTGLAGEIRSAMEATARAWLLTGDREYLRWCRELMLAIAGWRQWTDPWYGTQPCLDTHHLTRGMCVALDLLWDDLPADDRALIIEAIATKGAEFIYEAGNDPASYVATPGAWPNGYAMINTELAVAGLTLLGEHDDAQQWLAQGLEKTRLFFAEQGGVDGGLVEGFGYGSAAVDDLMYVVRKADAVVGVNLFDEPYLSVAVSFPAYFVVPGGGSLANFGDNGDPTGQPPVLLGLAEAMLEVEQSPLAAWYLRKAGRSSEEIQRLAEQPALPLAKHFRDIDWVAMRSGWADWGSLLAFKSGHVEHHNHLDQNSFILAWNREWLLSDPGYQIYDQPYPPEQKMTPEMISARHEYTYATIGHNAILVDGVGQIAERGHVIAFASTPAMDYARGDASACYEGLARYLRHVISVAPDYYVVFDEIATDGPQRAVEVLLHTTPDGEFTVEGAPLAVGESRLGQECSVTRTGSAVMRFVQPDRLLFEHRQHPHAEQYGHYLSALDPRVTDETIAWVVAAGPAGQVEVQARPVAGADRAVQVRIGGAVDTIALRAADDAATTVAGDLSFEGAAAMVREGRRRTERYALVDGTRLVFGESELISSDAPISAGALVEDGLLRASITCAEPAIVTLHCPVEPHLVRLTGLDTPVDVTLDEDAQAVTLELPAGSFELIIRAL